jgi:integrase/recombinase XerD
MEWFIELAYLKIDHIIDGRIKYKRRMTGKLYTIKILSLLEKLLSYYLIDKTKEDYLFNIIKK